jgi:hypothetical protein
LNPNEVLLEFKFVIDRALRVRKDRERCFERLCIFAGSLQGVSENDQDLHTSFDKLIVHAPQLGDMRAALQSLVLSHEEQDNFSATIIGYLNLAARIGGECEIGDRCSDLQFFIFHNLPSLIHHKPKHTMRNLC